MRMILVTVVLLVLVTIVYIVAYKTGYRAARDKARAVFDEFAGPVAKLLQDINRQAHQQKPPTTRKSNDKRP